MSWSITDLFPPWGDSGERPPDNFQYDGGDQVNEKHIDYLWSSLKSLEDDVRAALSDIDSNGDGVVDKAEAGASGFGFDGKATLGGDLEAVDGETIWDESATEIPDSALGEVATTTIAADTDDDGLVENYDETLLEDGGSRELDAADLAGGLGSAGQFLKSDGSAAVWDDAIDTRADVSEAGTLVVGDVEDINFRDAIDVVDDGDGTVTVDGPTGTKNTRVTTGRIDASFGAGDFVQDNNIAGMVLEEVEIKSSITQTVNVNYVDGTSDSKTVSGGSSEWFDTKDIPIASISANEDVSAIEVVGMNLLQSYAHQHNISP